MKALQAVTDVQIFNTTTNTWSTGPALPVARDGGAAVLVNNKIHFFGGLMPNRRTASSAHYMLDLNNHTAGWTLRAAMPDPRNHFAAVRLNGKIYAIGGQYNHDGPRSEAAQVDIYDPATNTWSDGVNLPSPISHHEPGTFVHNGKIILVSGGFEGTGNQNILQFNPATNRWSTLGQLPLVLFSATAKIIGNQLIVSNGGKNTRNDTRKETYITPFGTSVNQPPQLTSPFSNLTTPINSLFSFQFPANKFTDSDGDALTYSASLQNGNSLPAWLSFNVATRMFSGTPSAAHIGTYAIRVTASDQSASASGTFNLTVFDQNVPACVLQIQSLSLMYSGTAGEIGLLEDEDTINLNTYNSFSIRANPCSTDVKSVKFFVNGNFTRTESSLPFSIAGDNAGNYTKWNVGVGQYTVSVTPYSASGGGGTAGIPKIVSFTIINQSAVTDCNGVPNGNAFHDDCGICSGGNTGHIANSDKDDCGICFGNNANKDCNGVCFGTAQIDNCGVCAGGNTGIVPNSGCQPEPCSLRIENFILVQANSTNDIQPLMDGAIINLYNTPNINIRVALCASTVGSVKFNLNGSITIENTGPFVLAGDNSGVYKKWNVAPGSYTLTATAYSGKYATGSSGNPKTISFTVTNQSVNTDCNGDINGTAFLDACGICSGGNSGHVANSDKDDCGICFGNNTNKDCNEVCNGSAFIDGCGNCVGGNTGNAPCGGNAVTSLTLVSATTHQDIRQFVNGAVIDFALTGNKLSIRANTNPPIVGSIRFNYDDNANYMIENIAPYTIQGDNSGKYNAWTPTLGSHTLTVTPYSGRAATGTAGAAITVNFTVVNSAAKNSDVIEDTDENFELLVFPNPNEGLFNLHYQSIQENTPVRIEIYNALGKEIYVTEKISNDGIVTEQIDISTNPAGIYLLRAYLGEKMISRKLLLH